MLSAFGDTALYALSLPLFAVVLLFGVYFTVKANTRNDHIDR